MANVAYLALVLAFFTSIYAAVSFVVGVKSNNYRLLQSARGGVLAVAFLTTIASLLLMYFLLSSNFAIKYVYNYTSIHLPAFYKFAAFWAGSDGSLLLWAWLLAVFTAIVAYTRRFQDDTRLPWVNVVMLVNSIFFLSLLITNSNPFATFDYIPADGRGLNPMLQNPGMLFHPITIFLGYVGFAVPFAFAMAALIIKKVDDDWVKLTRRWSVVAWMFLTLGNLYGAQWAYVELGWGGYWAWDPVENASFMPWLTGTAFIHSIMIQERKNMLQAWNFSLIILTYLLTLFGTFIVRSGILTSVHDFGDSAVGGIFLVFIAIMLSLSVFLMIDRGHLLKDKQELKSYLSKESSFLLNNLLLLGSAFAVFWGTVFPLVSEAVRGIKVTVSAPFFNQVNGPIFLAMLFLMGVCPLIAWQRSSAKNLRDNFMWPMAFALGVGVLLYFILPDKRLVPILGFVICAFVLVTIVVEFYRGTLVRSRLTGDGNLVSLGRLMLRNRRRYGGYIVHLGIVLLAIGIIGSSFYKQEVTKTVSVGEEIRLGPYTMTYKGLQNRDQGPNVVVFAQMPVFRHGHHVGFVMPEKVFFENWEQPSTEVSIVSSLREDFYVILSTWESYGKEATFKVYINPLIAWMWIGGYLLVIGTLFAVWPGRGVDLGPKYTREKQMS
ncbi:MAG: heme lyase CcmF/NrfE family subunit [Syntrophomonadaceae bacterium]|nr:heme lyase CcmF/NrfE family subunit [Syntrophomonadaceae bacterium]